MGGRARKEAGAGRAVELVIAGGQLGLSPPPELWEAAEDASSPSGRRVRGKPGQSSFDSLWSCAEAC